MVIYADVLFVLNALIDYLLLLLSARAAGEPLRRVRFLMGAAVGGLYAVAIFLPGFAFLRGTVYKALSALFMLLVSYGATRTLVKQSAVFFCLACALGGGIMGIGMLDDRTLSLNGGVVYSIPDLKLVVLSAAICYALMSLVLPKICRHTRLERELCRVKMVLLDREIELTALVDTGNTLTDPVTGREIPVAEGAAVRSLFPVGCCPGPEDLRDPVAGMARLNTGAWSGRYRLVPYRAVGIDRGFLLAVKLDRMLMESVARERVLVALSPTPVSDGGGYQVLIGGKR